MPRLPSLTMNTQHRDDLRFIAGVLVALAVLAGFILCIHLVA
jgi:hypothetical protein